MVENPDNRRVMLGYLERADETLFNFIRNIFEAASGAAFFNMSISWIPGCFGSENIISLNEIFLRNCGDLSDVSCAKMSC